MGKRLSWLPAIIIMIMIFIFSSKPADISSQSSLVVTDYIYSVYEDITGQIKSDEERLNIISGLNYIVRKGAHVTEYAMLALAYAWPLWLRRLRGFCLALVNIGLTVIYAITDEIHQIFVPGRSGEIKDVFIDTIGALIGYLIFIIAISIYKSIQKHLNH